GCRRAARPAAASPPSKRRALGSRRPPRRRSHVAGKRAPRGSTRMRARIREAAWRGRGARRRARARPRRSAEAVGAAAEAGAAADRACGGTDDVAPAALGFAASCPAVTVPGGAACGGPVTTLGDLVACVTCVALHDAECADHAAAPAFLAYPPECAAPPGS